VIVTSGYWLTTGKRWSEAIERRMGMRYALINPILGELAKESKIERTIGKHGEVISPEE
jgi:hypothetical protein